MPGGLPLALGLLRAGRLPLVVPPVDTAAGLEGCSASGAAPNLPKGAGIAPGVAAAGASGGACAEGAEASSDPVALSALGIELAAGDVVAGLPGELPVRAGDPAILEPFPWPG